MPTYGIGPAPFPEPLLTELIKTVFLLAEDEFISFFNLKSGHLSELLSSCRVEVCTFTTKLCPVTEMTLHLTKGNHGPAAGTATLSQVWD